MDDTDYALGRSKADSFTPISGSPARTLAARDYNLRSMIVASSVGTLIEMYDFFIFGSLTAVISPLFYPPGNATFAYEAPYLPRLEAAGYELRVREPDFYEHRMLRTPTRDAHIHVFSPGAPEIIRVLTLRDRLRTNAEERKRYEDTKRRLAAQSWPDMDAYARAKTDVIESIMAVAIADGQESR